MDDALAQTMKTANAASLGGLAPNDALRANPTTTHPASVGGANLSGANLSALSLLSRSSPFHPFAAGGSQTEPFFTD
jgi:hypothetical protein